MAVLFGVLAAVCWGVSDFMIRVIGRSIGVLPAMVYAQGLGAVTLSVWFAVRPEWLSSLGTASAAALAGAALAAPIGLVATVALYEGMRVGRVGLVAPVTAAYGAVAAVLSLLTGETATPRALSGMALIVGGSVLVCRPARAEGSGEAGPREAGLGWALLSCLCFGLQFYIQGRFAAPELGAAIPVWIYYVLSTVMLGGVALWRKPPMRLPATDAAAVFGTGAIAVLGFVVLSAGLATGEIALVGVLGSTQSAVTVALACLFLGERLARHQWIGLATLIAGLALVNAG